MVNIKLAAIAVLVLTAMLGVSLAQGPRNIQKEKVVYALNCGSNEGFLSEHGFQYQPVDSFKSRIDSSRTAT